MSLLEERPILTLLRERRKLFTQRKGDAEETIREWRERGVPEPAVQMAMKMADRWLRAVMK